MGQIKAFLPAALQTATSKEFDYYCKQGRSVLKKTSPEELEQFSNESVIQEIATQCPFWYVCARGASAVNKSKTDSKN